MEGVERLNKIRLVIAVITAMAVILLCTVCLVACGEEHEFVDYVYNNDATCGRAGTETAKCKTCPKTNTRKSKAHPATGEHVFEDYVCGVCFEYAPDAPISEDLAFDKIKQNGKVVAYEVTGIGEADDAVFVPAMFNKKPVIRIGDKAFENSNYLKSIVIPGSVTSIGKDAFEDCKQLTEVKIGNGVMYIGSWAFSGCENLTHVDIPNSVISIGWDAFRNCKSLFEVTLPNGLDVIKNSTFSGCTYLNSVTVPDSVTKIEYMAFFGCTGLTSITIPSRVTEIGNDALWRCSSLNEIIFKGTVKKWRSIKKGSDWNEYAGNYTVTCTDGVISKADS